MPNDRLSLADRLSHLHYEDAVSMLGGEQGDALLRAGGRYDIDVHTDVIVDSRRFSLFLDDAVVTVSLAPERRFGLRRHCTRCGENPCEHLGAALSLILEEKLALGLSVPPEEAQPLETLSPEQLTEQALADRRQRALEEDMRVEPVSPPELWSDYLVTNSRSGRTYRVALRGWERGDSYCTCPDFATNTLGTCKHVLRVIEETRSRFPSEVLETPYVQTCLAVALHYGEELQLRFLAPPTLPTAVESIIAPLRDTPITDLQDLVRRIEALENLDQDVIVYPDAEDYLQRCLLLQRLEHLSREIRLDPANHPLRRQLLRAELLPYQLDGIGFALGAGRAVLADDMGLGKTIQGIGFGELLAREVGIRRVLVVCPASVKAQWAAEIRRFCHRSVSVVLGSARERADLYDTGAFFTVCNYEQVLRDVDVIETVHWDLVILDEGQRIKNWESKTSRVIKGLDSTFALVLSGTPLENRLEELYSVVEFVDARRLGPAFRFLHQYRVVNERGRVLGYRNLDRLRSLLAPVLLRRTRQSVMRELPPRTTEIVRVPVTQEQRSIHDTYLNVVAMITRKRYLTEMDLLRLRKALLMCRLAADSTYHVDRIEPLFSGKLERFREILAELAGEEDRKVLVFSEWTRSLDLMEPMLKRLGVDFVRLDGSVPQTQRPQLVARFQETPDCRVFLTTNAGATGLNLQAANTIINFDLPWNPAVLEQRIARAHRMGQTQPVQVFLLVSEDTLEEKLLDTLAAKQTLSMASLDQDADVTEVALQSGIEELKRRLEVLIGAAPEAEPDESQRREREREAEELSRRARAQEAGGRLVAAAFDLLGTVLPGTTAVDENALERVRESLQQCVAKDGDGRTVLTVTLDDGAALEGLCRAAAALMAVSRS